jgi:hypothetical protein
MKRTNSSKEIPVVARKRGRPKGEASRANSLTDALDRLKDDRLKAAVAPENSGKVQEAFELTAKLSRACVKALSGQESDDMAVFTDEELTEARNALHLVADFLEAIQKGYRQLVMDKELARQRRVERIRHELQT